MPIKLAHFTLIFSLVLMGSAARSSSDCQSWFDAQHLNPSDKECLSACVTSEVDMSTFSCHDECDQLCTTKIMLASCKIKQTAISCDFYQTCLENVFACGEDGYPLSYGKKYCQQFLAFKPTSAAQSDSQTLSSLGIQWRDNTLLRLQNTLVDKLSGDISKLSCDSIKDAAFESHTDCYLNDGISVCNLPVGDIYNVLKTPTIQDDFSKPSIEQGMKITFKCLQTWLFPQTPFQILSFTTSAGVQVFNTSDLKIGVIEKLFDDLTASALKNQNPDDDHSDNINKLVSDWKNMYNQLIILQSESDNGKFSKEQTIITKMQSLTNQLSS